MDILTWFVAFTVTLFAMLSEPGFGPFTRLFLVLVVAYVVDWATTHEE